MGMDYAQTGSWPALIPILGCGCSTLLRSPEEAPVDSLCQNVTLDRFDQVGARLERVGRWFHIHLGGQATEDRGQGRPAAGALRCVAGTFRGDLEPRWCDSFF